MTIIVPQISSQTHKTLNTPEMIGTTPPKNKRFYVRTFWSYVTPSKERTRSHFDNKVKTDTKSVAETNKENRNLFWFGSCGALAL